MTVFRKILAVLIGAVLVFVLIEGALRSFGYLYQTIRLKQNGDVNAAHAVSIVCLGDSFTFGHGAQIGYSYPEQLERLLKKDGNRKTYTVHNGGVCGNTSTHLVNQLEKDINNYNPAVIIVLIGNNDYFLDETNYYVSRNKMQAFFYRYFLNNFKTAQLAKRVINDIKAKYWKHKINLLYAKSDTRANPRGPVPENTGNGPECDSAIRLAQEAYQTRAGLENAEHRLLNAIALNPSCAAAYFELGRLYVDCLAKPHEAVVSLKKALELNQEDTAALMLLFKALYYLDEDKKAYEVLCRYLYRRPEEIPRYLSILENGVFSQKSSFSNLTLFNIQLIVDYARRRNIAVVLQNYPHDDLFLIKEYALKNTICFIDNYEAFRRIRQSPRYRNSDYFVEDAHCNNKGYSVIARNVYDALSKQVAK